MTDRRLIAWSVLAGVVGTVFTMSAGALLAFFAMDQKLAPVSHVDRVALVMSRMGEDEKSIGSVHTRTEAVAVASPSTDSGGGAAFISAAHRRNVERNVNDGEAKEEDDAHRARFVATGQRHRGDAGEGKDQGRPRQKEEPRSRVSEVRTHDRRRDRGRGFERTRAHGVKLARWCVTEDGCVLWPEGKGSEKWPECGTGGALSAECKAIVEVAEHNVRAHHKSWDDTLAFISPRVMNDNAEPRPGTRQHWLKTLQAESNGAPAEWHDSRDRVDEHDHHDGDWRLYDDNWQRLRDEMIEWWLTGPHDVCEGEPLAEGTQEEAERIAIPQRGFEEYLCEHDGEFVERLWIGGPPL